MLESNKPESNSRPVLPRRPMFRDVAEPAVARPDKANKPAEPVAERLPVAEPAKVSAPHDASFDKKEYQRAYMAQRRAAKAKQSQ